MLQVIFVFVEVQHPTLIFSCNVCSRSTLCEKSICLQLFFPSDRLALDMLSTSLQKPVETEEKKTRLTLVEMFFFFLKKNPKAFIVNHSEMKSENQIYIFTLKCKSKTVFKIKIDTKA